MRRPLAAALGLAVLLSLASLWKGATPHLVAAVDGRNQAEIPSDPLTKASATLPPELPRLAIDAAKRDIFAAVGPASAPLPLPVVAAPPPIAAVPPPKPQAPPVNIRFLGRMTTPSGESRVYLGVGDAIISAVVGDTLESGFVISDMTADAVTLVHQATESKVVVPIAPSPQQ